MNAAERYRALPPRHRAFVAVRTMRKIGMDPAVEGPRELTDAEIEQIEDWSVPPMMGKALDAR